MALDVPADGDDKRFTITDYYDPEPSASTSSPIVAHREPEPEPRAVRRLPSIPTSSTSSPSSPIASSSRTGSAPVTLAPAIAAVRNKQGSGSTTSSSSSPKLRLHQPDDRPTYHPSTLTTSPTHPLSPTFPLHQVQAGPSQPLPSPSSGTLDFGRLSSTSSDIRPLPSIPMSYASAMSAEYDSDSDRDRDRTQTLSSTTYGGGPATARSPGLTPMEEDDGPSALSPPVVSHRHSGLSGVSGHSDLSGRSDAWTTHEYGRGPALTARERDQEKEHEFPPAPTLDRGMSTSKATRWRDRWFPASTACRLLLLTVVLETIIDLIIEGNILWRFNAEIDANDATDLNFERKRRLPIYLVIYGLAHLWQLVLVVIAIRTRNTIQVIAVTAFNFAFLAYAVIQIYELRQILGGDLEDGLTDVPTSETLLTLPLNILTGIVIGVVAVGSLALLVLSIVIRREFGWDRYRFLGADLRIRAFYTRFQIYECICYFSAFFCAGFGIQFIWLVLQKTDAEYIITWVAFPLGILLLVLGRWAAKYENAYCMGVFMFGLVAGAAYFIFKLVRIWQEQYGTYLHLTKSLTVFNALSLASLGACLVFGIIVWLDFGKGLKEAVLSRPKASSLHSAINMWGTKSNKEEEARQDVDTQQRRISID